MRPRLRFAALLASAFAAVAAPAAEESRPRVRELGVRPGVLPTGRWNAITDVAGVRVGHRTVVEGDSIRTGVTAILPHDGNLFQRKVPGAVYVGNGFGKAAGFLQVRELGNIESPIVLTNTLAVAAGLEGVVRWTLAQPGNEGVRSVNAVVGETNDGYLNDIRSIRITAREVREAIDAARPGPVEEGNVGAGTGTRAFAWKGGVGTSSRVLPAKLGGYTVGALVQSNFGGILTIAGHRVGERLGRHEYREELEGPGGSCMMVLATDAPLSPRNLERLAGRAVLGLARTGSFMDNGSGDFVIAFSTRNPVPHAAPATGALALEELHNDAVSPLFLAAVESVEEAVYNSMTRAATMVGHQGRRVEAIPLEPLRAIFRAARLP
ncbi:MAG: P1 family peptidase [Thermoanaerobaculia bacterium]